MKRRKGRGECFLRWGGDNRINAEIVSGGGWWFILQNIFFCRIDYLHGGEI
jgi:hypothetical protein